MATETKRPDAEVSDVGLVASDFTDHDEDPDVSSVTINALNNDINTEYGVDFPTPTANPTTGPERQEFRVGVEEFNNFQTGVPTARIEVWDDGVQKFVGPETNVEEFSVVSLRWDSSILTNADGSTVQCKLFGTKSGGGAGALNSVRIGHIEWNAVYAVNYFDLFWKALEARIPLVWTDVDIIWRATQTRRINWKQLLDTGKFSVPFVVVQISAARSIDTAGMANKAHAYDVSIYYVRADKQSASERTGEILVEDTIELKLKALADDLYPTPPTTTGFQILRQPDIDISSSNPANAVFVDASAPYAAGSINCEFVIGETP